MMALSDFPDSPGLPKTWVLSINKYPVSECLQTKQDTQNILHLESSHIRHNYLKQPGNNICLSKGREVTLPTLAQTSYLTYLLYKPTIAHQWHFTVISVWRSGKHSCVIVTGPPRPKFFFFISCNLLINMGLLINISLWLPSQTGLTTISQRNALPQHRLAVIH